MSGKILLVGEPMGLLIAREEKPLEQVASFSAAVAGAEFNVAVGLTRLGHPAGYLTKLGDDPFGRRILNALEKNGIDRSLAVISKERPTGMMLKAKTQKGDPEIFYYRKNSAASTLDRADAENARLAGYGALHLTGIFPALSPSTLEAARCLLERARASGMTVFFDPNLRPQLWPDRRVMVRTINEFAAQADYFLPGAAEGEALMGSSDPEQIACYYRALGAGAVVVKTGAAGAFAMDAAGGLFCPGYDGIRVVDTVGAGDGFAAGVISAVCEGLTLGEAVRRGNAIGAIQVQHAGDNEGLPTPAELEEFMKTHPQKEGKA